MQLCVGFRCVQLGTGLFCSPEGRGKNTLFSVESPCWDYNWGSAALKMSTLSTDLRELLHLARPSLALLNLTHSPLCSPFHFQEVIPELRNRLWAASQIREVLLFSIVLFFGGVAWRAVFCLPRSVHISLMDPHT